MKLSVALATYNGAKFIDAQLESIAMQSRPPDELIVCDDASEDETVSKIAAFAKRAGFPIRLHVNSATLKTAKNFEKAISLCTGDLIALSDQDDLWCPAKLQRLEEAFLGRPELGMAWTDANAVSEDLQPLGFTLWQSIAFSKRQQRQVREGHALRVLLRHNVVTGATLMFRSAFRSSVLPIPPLRVHDEWIALMIAAQTAIEPVPIPLVLYRQHTQQQYGARGSVVDHLRWLLPRWRALCRNRALLFEEAGRRLAQGRTARAILQRLAAAANHANRRANFPQNRLLRLPLVIGELARLRYFRYSMGWYSAGLDLLHHDS